MRRLRAGLIFLALSAFAIAGCAYGPYGSSAVCELQPISVTPRGQSPQQPSAPGQPANGPVLIYLDVWGQVVAVVDDQGLREPALAGEDTTPRISPIARCTLLRPSSYPCPWCFWSS